VAVPGHTQVFAPQRPSQILYGHCCIIYPTVLTSHSYIVTCLAFWKEASEDTIMLVRRHWRMPCVCGCSSRGRATFSSQGYTLFIKVDCPEKWRQHWKVTAPSATL
jgi:hypothetical protein